MAIGALELFDAHAEKARGIPQLGALLHQPSSRRMAQGMWRDVGHAGVVRVASECLVDVFDGRAIPLHAEALSAPFPTPQMRQKPPRQWYGRAAFVCLSGTLWSAVENPALEIDIAATCHAPQRRAADRAGARAGVEADEDEACQVLPRAAAGRVALLDFTVAPRAPDQRRRFLRDSQRSRPGFFSGSVTLTMRSQWPSSR